MSLNQLIVLFMLFSVIGLNDSRFVWDFGSYCLNYCAKSQFKMSGVNVCSCHWISSNHRRMDTNSISSDENSPKFKLKDDLY